ncbi:MAG TPA: thioesterase [Flavobacteriales bacterium]|nr:thioesterase [Flavobacteriales bacterium]|tara:strand:+ start:759 stop:1178 length:420 start_codon:yes stop_codon:yes gene_type:complete
MTSKLYHSATFTVKWSDVDPNKHLRGAVYMDYADHARISFLLENGITNEFLNQLGFGPVLFNANIEYFKEVFLNDKITVDCFIVDMSDDFKKFSIMHLLKNQNGDEVAKITVNGAWMNLKTRKIESPPKEMTDKLSLMQ